MQLNFHAGAASLSCLFVCLFQEDDHAKPLMIPQHSEDHPSLLGNAREPPHHEGVIHMTGQMMANSIKDVAVRAPDGSMGQIDSIRNDQLGQQGIAPGFEKMQNPVPANENANPAVNVGQDNGKDESQRDYGPPGQHDADVNAHLDQKDVEVKAKDRPADDDEYLDDEGKGVARQQPVEVRTCYKSDGAHSCYAQYPILL